MHVSWTIRLLTLSAAFASLCILSCGSPTSVIPARDTTKHDSIPNAFPPTQAITKRVNLNAFQSVYWGNGWTSSALTYVRSPPCVPFLPSKRQSLTLTPALTVRPSPRQRRRPPSLHVLLPHRPPLRHLPTHPLRQHPGSPQRLARPGGVLFVGRAGNDVL